jgi:citronellol/citronellal dehydrogenase
MKRYDLMQDINCRGTFMLTRAAAPFLASGVSPHVLTLSPPINLRPHWAGAHLAYTISKYGMSLCTLGFAAEFRQQGIAVNSLWPRTLIGTAAVRNLLGGAAGVARARRPEIVADAAHAVLVRDSRSCTGNFFIDDEVLAESGVVDLDSYRISPGRAELATDIFLD